MSKFESTSSLDRMAAGTVRLVRAWRSEVPEQWPSNRVEIDHEKFRRLLEECGSLGLEPRLLCHLVLGTEWAFRARVATSDDIEVEIRKIKDRLFDLRDPILWADQTPAFQAMAAKLRKLMRRDRYLVSLRCFAHPDKLWFLRLPRGQKPVAPMPRIQAVLRKRGPITRVGPRLAAVLVEGLLIGAGQSRKAAETRAIALAEVLLVTDDDPERYRAVGISRAEFRRWRKTLDIAIQDPQPWDPEGEQRSTARRWLIFRYRRVCASQGITSSWGHMLAEIRQDPEWAFSPLGSARDIAALYALSWG